MKLIILDRDGVINKDLGRYVETANEFEFIDGSVSAIVRLKQSGYTVAIATNQAGIEKGIYTHQQLSSVHYKMLSIIRNAGGDIDRIVYCPYKDNSHPWRKPNSGMLVEILKQYKQTPSSENNIYFIGDTVRDMVAAVSASCTPMMVTTGKGNIQQYKIPNEFSDKITIFNNLNDAVSVILNKTNK